MEKIVTYFVTIFLLAVSVGVSALAISFAKELWQGKAKGLACLYIITIVLLWTASLVLGVHIAYKNHKRPVTEKVAGSF